MPKGERTDHSIVTKILHWATALLIIALIWLGWYMVGLSYYDKWHNLSLTAHRALGMLVFALALLKLCWNLFRRSPGHVATLKPWERTMATATHLLLYIAMLLIPSSGYVISTSNQNPVPFFDLFEIPALFAIGNPLRDWAIEVHYYAAYTAAIIIVLHAGAALKHHFIDKDDTLKRML